MTFGATHYVPVLKVKLGEKAALGRVAPNLKARITPLLQIVERTDKNLTAHLNTAFKGLGPNLAGYSRCFIDPCELEPDGPAGAAAVFQQAAALGIVFTPVTGVSRVADVAAALAHRQSGLALRMSRDEFEHGDLSQRVNAFLSTHALKADEVDAIVDLGAVDDMIPEGIAAFAQAFLAEIPHQQSWKTLTLSACSFPMSMGIVDRHSHELVERGDWLAWRNFLYAARHDMTRLPTYSDYGIQHPKGVEGFDFRIMQVSATIRYTLDEHWLLIKGESTRSTRPGEQFPQIATRLVYGHLQSYFAGAQHCAGCHGIKAAADGAPRYGSAGAWRKLGTIHHVSQVIHSLDALPWP